ncbi:hypothetical protein LSTR_LSTR015662, partial [Laodelphax striatellus]
MITIHFGKKCERYSPSHTGNHKDDASDIELGELKTKSLIEQVNRILMNNLGRHAPHIFNAEVDYDPRFEAFWK